MPQLVSLEQLIQGHIEQALFRRGWGGALLAPTAEKLARTIVNDVARHLGDDTLRAEVRTVVREVNVYYPSTYRRAWTPAERRFRLAMREIDAEGELPTNTRIALKLGWDLEKRSWGDSYYRKKGVQINSRESGWRQEEMRLLGYVKKSNGRWAAKGGTP